MGPFKPQLHDFDPNRPRPRPKWIRLPHPSANPNNNANTNADTSAHSSSREGKKPDPPQRQPVSAFERARLDLQFPTPPPSPASGDQTRLTPSTSQAPRQHISTLSTSTSRNPQAPSQNRPRESEHAAFERQAPPGDTSGIGRKDNTTPTRAHPHHTTPITPPATPNAAPQTAPASTRPDVKPSPSKDPAKKNASKKYSHNHNNRHTTPQRHRSRAVSIIPHHRRPAQRALQAQQKKRKNKSRAKKRPTVVPPDVQAIRQQSCTFCVRWEKPCTYERPGLRCDTLSCDNCQGAPSRCSNRLGAIAAGVAGGQAVAQRGARGVGANRNLDAGRQQQQQVQVVDFPSPTKRTLEKIVMAVEKNSELVGGLLNAIQSKGKERETVRKRKRRERDWDDDDDYDYDYHDEDNEDDEDAAAIVISAKEDMQSAASAIVNAIGSLQIQPGPRPSTPSADITMRDSPPPNHASSEQNTASSSQRHDANPSSASSSSSQRPLRCQDGTPQPATPSQSLVKSSSRAPTTLRGLRDSATPSSSQRPLQCSASIPQPIPNQRHVKSSSRAPTTLRELRDSDDEIICTKITRPVHHVDLGREISVTTTVNRRAKSAPTLGFKSHKRSRTPAFFDLTLAGSFSKPIEVPDTDPNAPRQVSPTKKKRKVSTCPSSQPTSKKKKTGAGDSICANSKPRSTDSVVACKAKDILVVDEDEFSFYNEESEWLSPMK